MPGYYPPGYHPSMQSYTHPPLPHPKLPHMPPKLPAQKPAPVVPEPKPPVPEEEPEKIETEPVRISAEVVSLLPASLRINRNIPKPASKTSKVKPTPKQATPANIQPQAKVEETNTDAAYEEFMKNMKELGAM